MHPKIEIRSLQKSYTSRKRESKVVLYHLDLAVFPGEFLVLLGESGCGKSTLLKVISGIEDYDFGDIYFDGMEAASLEQREKNMSYVSQNYALFPAKTVYENIDMPLANLRWNKERRKKRIIELSALLGLDLLLSRKPKELSGGQAQRVAIARSLAKNPDICLFDEPLSALDQGYHEQIIGMLKEIHDRTFATYVYSTHNQREAFALGDRIAIMHEMKIEQIGTGEEILKRPVSPYICSFLKDLFPLSVNGAFHNGHFISDDGDFLIGVKDEKKANSFEGRKIRMFVRKDAIRLDDSGVLYPVIKQNADSVQIMVAGEALSIGVDEGFEGDGVRVDIDRAGCVFFADGRNIDL